MSYRYEFVQVDVFTKAPLTGNPLAIFPDGRGLSDQQMQALAREMNLSETTFILSREPQVEKEEGKRVRIFTVEEELPFAGHPTLGTALYLYHAATASLDEILLDLNVGKVRVRFKSDTNDRSDRVAGDIFGEMCQRDPDFGVTLAREQVAGAIGCDPGAVASEWPCQVVSTGLPFAIVPIRDLEVLTNLKPDLSRAGALLQGTGARFCYFICPDLRQDPVEVRARMFFYGGEDPATGSAAGCAISWLVQHEVVESDAQVLIHQGVEAGRRSEIFVRATRSDDRVTNVRVGGYAVEVLRGMLTFSPETRSKS